MKKINLNTEEYTNQFAAAAIYAKKGVIKAVQITEDGLKAGEYVDKDIRFDNEKGQYVIDTYVMRENFVEGTFYIRSAELEDTRPVEVGEWIATNPKTWETDHDNNYVIPDATFHKRYDPLRSLAYIAPKVWQGLSRMIPAKTWRLKRLGAARRMATQNATFALHTTRKIPTTSPMVTATS